MSRRPDQTASGTSLASTRCLAEVDVTERAPDDGEHHRRRDGWTLTVHPATVTPTQVNRHLCDVVRAEEDVLAGAPRPLFASGPGSRRAQFLDVCAEGPTDRAYVDQAIVCGVLPPTPEQAYVLEAVYDEHVVPVAPEIDVVREAR